MIYLHHSTADLMAVGVIKNTHEEAKRFGEEKVERNDDGLRYIKLYEARREGGKEG